MTKSYWTILCHSDGSSGWEAETPTSNTPTCQSGEAARINIQQSQPSSMVGLKHLLGAKHWDRTWGPHNDWSLRSISGPSADGPATG